MGTGDSLAMQAAIDSGATTVYLPRGTWNVDGDVILRGNVERLIGTEAHIAGRGKIRIANGRSKTVVIERLQGGGVTYEHASRRTVVFRHLLGWTYRAAIEHPGDVFVEDVVGAPVVFRRQNVWARQLDIEGDIEHRSDIEAKLVNDGGRTELLGALHVGGATQGARFITENASFSAAVAKGGTDLVQEARDGETRGGRFGNADLYTAFRPEAIETIYVDNADADRVEVTGEWESVSSAPGGFIEHDLLRAKPQASGRVAFTLPVRQPGRYDAALRWINQISSPIRYARDVRVEVVHAEGTAQLSIDQQRGGGQWNRLGAYRFEPESEAKVIVSTEDASGHVQADAVRLTRTRRTPR
jgi:hypothetical protein